MAEGVARLSRQLYIDPGPAGTGWCIGDGPVVLGSGTQRLKDGTKGLSATVKSASRYVTWLSAMLDSERFDRVHCEQAFMRAKFDRFVPWAVLQTELICHRRVIEWRPINGATLKREMGGSGRASDREMMAAARARGFNPRTPHEADALLMHAMVHQEPSLPLAAE